MLKKKRNNPDLQYYWACLGPFSRKKLDEIFPHGESCIRTNTELGFLNATKEYPKTHASGWGVSKEQFQAISFATYDDETKKRIINSYIEEEKELPRWIKAWDLLFKEESKK